MFGVGKRGGGGERGGGGVTLNLRVGEGIVHQKAVVS